MAHPNEIAEQTFHKRQSKIDAAFGDDAPAMEGVLSAPRSSDAGSNARLDRLERQVEQIANAVEQLVQALGGGSRGGGRPSGNSRQRRRQKRQQERESKKPRKIGFQKNDRARTIGGFETTRQREERLARAEADRERPQQQPRQPERQAEPAERERPDFSNFRFANRERPTAPGVERPATAAVTGAGAPPASPGGEDKLSAPDTAQPQRETADDRSAPAAVPTKPEDRLEQRREEGRKRLEEHRADQRREVTPETLKAINEAETFTDEEKKQLQSEARGALRKGFTNERVREELAKTVEQRKRVAEGQQGRGQGAEAAQQMTQPQQPAANQQAPQQAGQSRQSDEPLTEARLERWFATKGINIMRERLKTQPQ